MKFKKFFLIIIFLLVFGIFSYAISLKLPFPEGKKYVLTQGYDVFTHKNKDLYALDFATPHCGGGYGDPILVTADGKVISVQRSKQGYGNNILIDHGNNIISRYAHLKETVVSLNEEVKQGQQIGTMGNTGLAISHCKGEYAGTHLHFALYEKEIREDKEGKKVTKYHPLKPEPMSGYSHFAAGKSYLSDNRLFKKGIEGNRKLAKEESKIIKKDSSSESLKKESKPKEKDKEKKKKESREIETKKIERKDELKKKEKNDPKSLVLKPISPTSKDSKKKKDSKEEKPKENLEKQSKEKKKEEEKTEEKRKIPSLSPPLSSKTPIYPFPLPGALDLYQSSSNSILTPTATDASATTLPASSPPLTLTATPSPLTPAPSSFLTLFSPLDQIILREYIDPLIFKWEEKEEITSYELIVFKNKDLPEENSVLRITNLAKAQYSVLEEEKPNLFPPDLYFWQIKGKIIKEENDQNTKELSSPIFSFRIRNLNEAELPQIKIIHLQGGGTVIKILPPKDKESYDEPFEKEAYQRYFGVEFEEGGEGF